MEGFRKFKNEIKRFYQFNKIEVRGSLICMGIIILMLLFEFFLKKYHDQKPGDFEAFQKEITDFQNSIRYLENNAAIKKEKEFDFTVPDQSSLTQHLNPFPFDPNQMSPQKWRDLGLLDWQIKTLLNFQSKGGKFRTKDDFKKMYCIRPEEFDVLQDYIVIPVVPKDTFFKRTPYPLKQAIAFDINAADTSELILLPGIGSGFARRIVAYRDRLGGFCKKEQLLEVWGMDTVRYNKCSNALIVNVQSIRKININTAEIKDLMKHPYIDFYLARAIVKYRKAIGQYESVAQICAAGMLYKELYDKISPYLCVQ